MIDTNTIVATSEFQGFQNYNTATFSVSYAGGTIAAGGYVGPERAETVLNNTNAVSLLQVMFTGLDSFTRQFQGFLGIDYPSFNSPSYQIEVISYYNGGNLVCDAYIINESAITVTIPAITFTYTAKLYQAPF